MKHALFYMPKDRSERIIANHNFYYPEFIYCSDQAYIDYADHSNLKVDDAHITEFSDAIMSFWKDVPEYIWEKATLNVPDWFESAFNKEQKNGEMAVPLS